MKKPQFFIMFLVIFLGYCATAGTAQAYLIESLNLKPTGSVIIGPGKTELLLAPGDSYTMEVDATNATGMTKVMKFTTEDMASSNNPETPLQFLGDQKGPYSLKDYVKPESDTVTLLAGQRVRMPVTISIPADAAPGGLYGSIMVAANNVPGAQVIPPGTAGTQVNIITRVAVLLFVRIKGPVLEAGYLKDFTANKSFYEAGPVSFTMSSVNTGNVYLSPYGTIEVKDMLGRTVDTRDIDPWFVLPKSDRSRQITWNSNFLLGKYTAYLTLHRGYMNTTDVVDTKAVTFWIIPWKILSVVAIALILVILFFVWVFSHIQWKKPSDIIPPSDSGTTAPPPVFPKDSQSAPYLAGNKKKVI